MASSTSTKHQRYLEVWKEWSRTNPAAIENDSPEWWDAVRAALGEEERLAKAESFISKHPGKGGSDKHSTGTGQEVHGKGGGGDDAAARLKEMEREIDELKLATIPNLNKSISDLVGEEAKLYRVIDEMKLTLNNGRLRPDFTSEDITLYEDHIAELEETLEGFKASTDNLKRKLSNSYTRLKALQDEVRPLRIKVAGLEGVVFPSQQIGHPTPLPDIVNVPETMLPWTEPPANYAILKEVDEALFPGTDLLSPDWRQRTSEGMRAVANTMDTHFGDEITQEINAFKDDYKEFITTFVDEQWTEYTGVESIDGYDADGNETWRKHMGPRWIEGQGVMEIQRGNQDPYAPISEVFDHKEKLVEGGFRGADSEAFDPDDPFELREFVNDHRFIDAIQGEGIDLRMKGRAYTDAPIQMERMDAARSRTFMTISDSLREAEWEQGYILEMSKETSSIAETIGLWELGTEKIVFDLRERWANSSTDPFSVAVQYAIEDHFPTSPDMAHFPDAAAEEGDAIYKHFPKTLEAYVKSVYSVTQDTFAKEGITHVPLIRGMGAIEGDDFEWGDRDHSIGDWERGFDLFDEIDETPSFDESGDYAKKEFDNFSIYKFKPTGSLSIYDSKEDHRLTLDPHEDGYKISWVKGFVRYDDGAVLTDTESLIDYLRSDHPDLLFANSDWVPASVDMQPLSSFSTNTDTSRSFAPVYDSDGRGMTHSVVLRATVPVNWIWGHSSDGFGSLREHEVLVIGDRDLPFEAIAVPIGDSIPSEILYKALGSDHED